MSFQSLLAWGVFVSVPFVGGWLWPSPWRRGGLLSALVRRCSAGAAAWSLVLLAGIESGHFRPAAFGAAGWLLAAAGVTVLRRGRRINPPLAGLQWPAALLVAALAALAAVNGIFSSQHILGGRDMGIYANTAISAVRSGRAAISYPIIEDDKDVMLPPFFTTDDGDGVPPFPGLNVETTHMTPQFSHLYPAWLGQAYAAGGLAAMFGFNAAVGLLSALALFLLASRFVPALLAAAVTLLLVFNPGQVWLSRITMSEIAAQFFLMAAFVGIAEYVESGGAETGVWGGVLIGAAILVRIDSLLAVPTALAGFGALRFLGWRSEEPRPILKWRAFGIAAILAGGAAMAYYWQFCKAYTLDTLPLTEGAAVATAGALMLFVPLPTAWARAISRAASSRTALWVLAAVLAALFAYGLLWRPFLQPFGTWKMPGHIFDGLRDYREDTLVNLLAYLTPLVPPLSILGALVLFRGLQQGRTDRWAAPVLTVFSGICLAFLYWPAVDPWHIWAFRRFIPVAVPGLLVLAAVGGHAAWNVLQRRWRRGIAAAFALCLLIISCFVDAPFMVHAEYQGLYRQVASLAADARGAGYLFARSPGGWGLWETPLLMTFRIPVLPIDLTDTSQTTLFAQYVGRERSEGRATRLAWEGGLPPGGLDLKPVAQHVLKYAQHVPTLSPPPSQWQDVEMKINLFDVTGLSMLDRVLGGGPLPALPGAREEGFWPPRESVWAPPARWTNGRAEMEIPCPDAPLPTRLQLYVDSSKPGKTTLAVWVQGRRLMENSMAEGARFFDLPLHDIKPQNGKMKIALVSDPWVPSQVIPASRDDRRLGVYLEGVRLATRPFAPPNETMPASACKSELRRVGGEGRTETAPEHPAKINLWVTNAGEMPWASTRERGGISGSVRLGARWYVGDAAGQCVGESRADLPFGLYPGESAPVAFRLLPAKIGGGFLPPGRYRVAIGLLQEGVQWFSASGDKTLHYEVEVGR